MSVQTIYYDGLKKFDKLVDVFAWQREVFKADNSWNNEPVKNSMIISPYLTLKLNGKDAPVYAARATFSTHSFAYAEVDSDDVCVEVEITLSQKRNNVVVLPESKGVKAEIEGDFTVRAKITQTGSFSFVFDHYTESAFTLMVRRKYPFQAPAGYKVVEFAPGLHELSETTNLESNAVYYFRHGEHEIYSVDLPSDSMLYLEDGAILKAKKHPTQEHGCPVCTKNTKNVTVCGKGAFDYSALYTGTVAFSMVLCENVTVRDVTLINSSAWTVCFTNCKNVVVDELLLVAYRIFSDGIMLSDCVGGRITNCFIRTGDDAAEVKSTGDGSTRTDDILFKNIAAWMDKACAYGVVYEANYDTQNVRFEDCSVGFALPNWSKHLGCITVNTGNNPKATDYNVFFKNFEVYYTLCSTVAICAYEGDIKDIYVENVNVKYSFHDAPVLVWIRDDVKKARVEKLYLDNITVNNVALTEETAKDLIRIDVPNEGDYDKKNIIINSLK